MSLRAFLSSGLGRAQLSVPLSVVFISFVFASTQTNASTPSKPLLASASVKERVQKTDLSEALSWVSSLTGVVVQLSPSLADDQVLIDRNGSAASALRELLERFDHLAIVGPDGAYRKIWLTGRTLRDHGSTEVSLPPLGALHEHADQEDYRLVSDTLPMPLWGSVAAFSEDSEHGHGEPVRMNPEDLERLRVGQPVEIPIPQEGASVFGVIGEGHRQLNGDVKVWSGPIDGSQATASFTVTQGRNTTYVTVATGRSIYEVSLDNQSGFGSVVNEVDLHRGKTGHDIVIPATGKATPSGIQQLDQSGTRQP